MEDTSSAVKALTRRYTLVYALGTFGDWIQGAYLYAAYQRHGLAKREIGYIYILGYAVSATIGTSAAALGDVYGHKALVVTYGLTYALSCMLLRSSALTALVVSRVFGGVAYSLLFSSFESWVITQADDLKIDRAKLVGLFSVATFFNAASAVAAGLIGNAVVELTGSYAMSWLGMDETRDGLEVAVDTDASRMLIHSSNSYTPAFDVATLSLLCCALSAQLLWKNIPRTDAAATLGAPGSPAPAKKSMDIFGAIRAVYESNELFRLGLANSFYEAALHLFVFVWTPVLEKRYRGFGAVPYGMVFSTFMVCKMIGSQVFQKFGDRITAEKALRLTLMGSAVSFFITVVIPSYWITLFAFCVFEFGLGIYWPTMSVLRAKYVPNKMRSTMTSVFRIPLNVLVVVSLLVAGEASERILLALCTAMMIICLAFRVA